MGASTLQGRVRIPNARRSGLILTPTVPAELQNTSDMSPAFPVIKNNFFKDDV
jgi:hypothetical protein